MLPKRTYRYEQKYLITGPQYQELRSVMAALLQPDPNAGPGGTYMIRSLYFDDLYRSAYNEKESGVYARKKYRVRVYNCRDSQIQLECKYKQGAYISKESLALTRGEYQQLAGGDCRFLLQKSSQMGKEFCVDSLSRLLRPDVIVDYEREPYVMEAGTVRVTFDKDVRAARPGEDLFDPGIPSYGVLEPGRMIMEIKFTGYLPEQVRRIFRLRDLPQTSASKFCLCADRIRQI